MDLNREIEKFGRKYFRFLSILLKVGLIISLGLSFYNGNIEPVFWFMGISLALAGLLISIPSNHQKFMDISRDFIYSTFSFVIAIGAGGIFNLFGKNISLYHIFTPGHPLIELFINGLVGFLYGFVGLGIILGSSYFINAIVDLFFIVSKDDKRPVKGIF